MKFYYVWLQLSPMNLSMITRSLGDKLPGDEMWETGPYVNDYECRSIPKCYDWSL